MSVTDFLRHITATLDEAAVPYMVTGSFASTLYGMPRTTQDLDVIVVLDGASLKRLLTLLPEDDWYISDDAAREAIRRRSQFNILHLPTGWKADLIVRKPRPFSETEFARRVRATVLGVPLWMATAEDTVIAKLEWSIRSGGSERQLRDVAGILKSKGDTLDTAYVDRWVRELALEAAWKDARALTL